jgi:hypothetical protein
MSSHPILAQVAMDAMGPETAGHLRESPTYEAEDRHRPALPVRHSPFDAWEEVGLGGVLDS